jgi:hypothetical protein
MALSFNWIGLSTTNARIGVRIPMESQYMPLSFNCIGPAPSKGLMGVRVSLGVQMESNAVWLPSLFAKQRVPSGMGFDFSALRFFLCI